MSANFEGYLANGYYGEWLPYPISSRQVEDMAKKEKVDPAELVVLYVQINGKEYRLSRRSNGTLVNEFNKAGALLEEIPDVYVQHMKDFLIEGLFYDVYEFINSWRDYKFYYPDLTSYWDIGNEFLLLHFKDSVVSDFVDREALGKELAKGLMTEDGYFDSISLDKTYGR